LFQGVNTRSGIRAKSGLEIHPLTPRQMKRHGQENNLAAQQICHGNKEM
jgi:hypothetical protein